VQITSTQLSKSQWIGPSVRSQNNGQSDYVGRYSWNSGSPTLTIFKRMSGTWTQLGSTYQCGALTFGTTLELSVSGNTLTFYLSGIARITTSDSSLTGGAPGIMAYGKGRVTDWSGGDASSTPPPTYAVGGSVSGLTGSVVLQDNGTDSLTATTNGSFSFATPLSSGATYNVTVTTNPTGQVCSVANGSGTVANANVTTVAVTCSASQAGAISAAGGLYTAVRPSGSDPVYTLSVNPQKVGDLLLFGLEDSNTSFPTTTSVTGGGVTSWVRIASDPDLSGTDDNDEIWEGVVTSTGPSTITATLNGFTDDSDLVAQEFTGATTWTLDKAGTVTGTYAQTFSYPSLTPASSGELYFGMGNAVNNTLLTGNGTPGASYVVTGLPCVSLIAYNTNTTSTFSPSVTNTGGAGNAETAVAVLISGN
jgi:hypothetical protein